MHFTIGKISVRTFLGRRANGKWFGYGPLRPLNRTFGARMLCLPFVNVYIKK